MSIDYWRSRALAAEARVAELEAQQAPDLHEHDDFLADSLRSFGFKIVGD